MNEYEIILGTITTLVGTCHAKANQLAKLQAVLKEARKDVIKRQQNGEQTKDSNTAALIQEAQNLVSEINQDIVLPSAEDFIAAITASRNPEPV